jgi:hypothetical protein
MNCVEPAQMSFAFFRTEETALVVAIPANCFPFAPARVAI